MSPDKTCRGGFVVVSDYNDKAVHKSLRYWFSVGRNWFGLLFQGFIERNLFRRLGPGLVKAAKPSKAAFTSNTYVTS
eukprot:4792436-Amphidinium_carterae.1